MRFSTVSGYSPNQNDFLIVNKMHLKAIKNKKITVINPGARKSLLFIDDLCSNYSDYKSNKKINLGL